MLSPISTKSCFLLLLSINQDTYTIICNNSSCAKWRQPCSADSIYPHDTNWHLLWLIGKLHNCGEIISSWKCQLNFSTNLPIFLIIQPSLFSPRNAEQFVSGPNCMRCISSPYLLCQHIYTHQWQI